MIAAAKSEIRSHIEVSVIHGLTTRRTVGLLNFVDFLQKSRGVQDESQVQELQAQGREAAEFLRTSIMQSSPNERGNWQVELNQEHAGRVVEPISPESVGKP